MCCVWSRYIIYTDYWNPQCVCDETQIPLNKFKTRMLTYLHRTGRVLLNLAKCLNAFHKGYVNVSLPRINTVLLHVYRIWFGNSFLYSFFFLYKVILSANLLICARFISELSSMQNMESKAGYTLICPHMWDILLPLSYREGIDVMCVPIHQGMAVGQITLQIFQDHLFIPITLNILSG